MSIILNDRDNATMDYVFEYDERYTVKVEILIDEDPSTYVVPLVFTDHWPTWEDVKALTFEFCETINVTPNNIRPLKVSEWDD